MLGSFKVKLVVYFLLLALVPLGAAFWGFSAVVTRGETQRVDARLESGLRAAVTTYQDEVLAAGRAATKLARDRSFQQALARGETASVNRALRGIPHAHVLVGPRAVEGAAKDLVTQRAASVLSDGRVLGEVVITIPLEASLLRQLQRRAGLDPADTLV